MRPLVVTLSRHSYYRLWHSHDTWCSKVLSVLVRSFELLKEGIALFHYRLTSF
jgi:hypothetical protein